VLQRLFNPCAVIVPPCPTTVQPLRSSCAALPNDFQPLNGSRPARPNDFNPPVGQELRSWVVRALGRRTASAQGVDEVLETDELEAPEEGQGNEKMRREHPHEDR
jgi:hypothetical protein